jgi:glucuronate isomerase
MKIEGRLIRQLKILKKNIYGNMEDKEIRGYTDVLQDMKERKPTYLEQGAKWDDHMLPKRKVK